jgi:hypothetical protein
MLPDAWNVLTAQTTDIVMEQRVLLYMQLETFAAAITFK